MWANIINKKQIRKKIWPLLIMFCVTAGLYLQHQYGWFVTAVVSTL
jgi:hypothetical protein